RPRPRTGGGHRHRQRHARQPRHRFPTARIPTPNSCDRVGFGMSGNHDHSHNLGPDHRKPLAVVLGITVTVMLVEVVGAAVTGSLALLADAGHMLTDVAGLTMALVAAALSRRPPTPSRTWGFLRVEILS